VIFADMPPAQAQGAIAAHSVRAGDLLIRKGTRLAAEHCAALVAAGIAQVTVAREEPGDIGEDEAAQTLAQALAGPHLRLDPPFTGRCNLFSEVAGVLMADAAHIDAVNGVDEAITVATLPLFAPVTPGTMVATVKIIPYAVPGSALNLAAIRARDVPLTVAPYRRRRVAVLSTLTDSLKPSVVDKTLGVLAGRLAPTGAAITRETRGPHATTTVAEAVAAFAASDDECLVIFGASAVADRRDVIPAGIVAAGGRVNHLGMPVDPGNLLLVAEIAGKPVIGAPGCARSPRENGFDWVLQRLLADLPVGRSEIMGLGVGGLLMEIVSRPQPRAGGTAGSHEDHGS
jgi:molybdenum cofactor cytidylyltransferase